jgi:hypothetical protein
MRVKKAQGGDNAKSIDGAGARLDAAPVAVRDDYAGFDRWVCWRFGLALCTAWLGRRAQPTMKALFGAGLAAYLQELLEAALGAAIVALVCG